MLFSVLMAPFVALILVILALASLGRSFGIRKLYVDLLLRLFEYGRVNIESANKKRETVSRSEEEDTSSHTLNVPETPKQNGMVKKLSQSVISKESLTLVPEGGDNQIIQNGFVQEKADLTAEPNANNDFEHSDQENADKQLDFKIEDCLEYLKSGIEAIIEDDVTSRFEAEELKNWNLLTRTNRRYEFISWKLTIIWVIGFFIRYLILMPLRVIICFIGVVWFVAAFPVVASVPNERLRFWMNDLVSLIGFRIIARSISAVITFHNEEYKPKNCGFCVANHTSPMDVSIMASDCTYSLIGQRHGGFLGVLQRALARASPHIWFERAEAKDRSAVASRLKQHVSDPKNPPILIFPEGTCINNTSVMQFKKGSFEVGGVIYPVAIKYDARFGDAFWNSSRYSMMQYLFLMMTSWAIVCDVWYLPPMYREENESAIDFANRVKSVIAKQGGLVDLVWDGQLKRMKPKKEWKERQQEEFTKRLKGD